LAFPCWLAVGLATAARAAPPTIPDAVKTNIRQRVEYGHMTGIAVGVVEADGRAYFQAGETRAGSGVEPGPDTLFEIGSITKAFTGTLLAQMVAAGEVTLGQSAQSLVPAGVTVPSGTGPITLLHLATHRSGLPENPDNLCSLSLHDSFACYSAEKLYEFLNGHTLTREPGAAWAYSNVGVGLLGQALAGSAGLGYEALLRERLLDPLGLDDTRIELSEGQDLRRAAGHWGVVPWPDFAFDGMEGAGALLSTVDDLLTFLEHVSGLKSGALGFEPTDATRRRAATGTPNLTMGLGWILVALPGGEVVQHDGATYGQNAFAGFHRASRRGVAVLCNNRISTYGGAQDVGFHLLDSSFPLTAPRRPASVPEATLASYEGRYVGDGGIAFDAEVRHGRLTLKFSEDGSPGFTIHAESATRFGAYEVGLNGIARFDVTGADATLTWSQGAAPLEFARLAVPPSLEIARAGDGLQLILGGTPGFQYLVTRSDAGRGWAEFGLHRPDDGAIPVSPDGERQGLFRAGLPPLEP
jgi:CubicO group peptidase (beta-lactamase class C family)